MKTCLRHIPSLCNLLRRASQKHPRLIAATCLCGVLMLLWLCLGLIPHPLPLEHRDFSRLVCDRNGEMLRLALTEDQKYRIRMRITDLPSQALDYVLAYEDRYFWWHPGVNPVALVRGFMSLLTGGRRIGGSTLTMQTVRLAYGLRTDTIAGKLRQIFWALWLERVCSKTDILEAYCNLAPYGGNVEGLAAAACVYFHKPVSSLTRTELETLMLVPQNPVRRRPDNGNTVLQKACIRQWYRNEEYAPVRFFGLRDLPFHAPHLTTELLRSGGKAEGVIRTTLDLRTQKLLERGIRRYVERTRAFGISNASAMLVHWPSMEVRALVGSADFSDPGISGEIDGTRARRSPGSTLKPFIYALALAQGLIHPKTILVDTPKSFSGYDPENFDLTFRGPVPADQALRMSRNVPALTLAGRLRNPDLYTFLRSCRVSFLSSAEHYGLALVLGGAEVTMRELASLYAMLPNAGLWRPLRFLAEEERPVGIPQLSPEVAFVTLSMLVDPGMDRVRSRGGQEISVRCKTGTSNGFRDAWTCGIVGPYVLVVWVGNFSNASNPLLVGGRIAFPLYMELMRMLAREESMQDRDVPDASLNVSRIPVCAHTGDLTVELCPERTETWFIPGVSPVKPTGILQEIFLDPRTGERVCVPEEDSRKVVWEVWPSSLTRLFELAGTPKPPLPPYEAGCRRVVSAGAPRIVQPKPGLQYYARYEQGGRARILLQAESETDRTFTWYVNGERIGQSQDAGPLIWEAEPGRYHIMVVDSERRATVMTLSVHALP